MRFSKRCESLILIEQIELPRVFIDQTSLVLILLNLFVFGGAIACSSLGLDQKNDRKITWNEQSFTVGTGATTEKKAVWMLRQEGDLDLPVVLGLPDDKGESVIEVFNKAPESKKAHGIFIYSKSFAIPDTPEERQFMGPYLSELYNDKQWRNAESGLINDLSLLCNSRGIPLYVNLSANLQGEWKQLAPSPAIKK